MNCPFCHGPTIPSTSKAKEAVGNNSAKNDPRYLTYHQDMTCPACNTPDCEVKLNFLITKETKQAELINYWLKGGGYTAVVGVSRQYTEVTKDWHTRHHNGCEMTTMCFPILNIQTSMTLTPKNFLSRVQTMLTFQ